MPETIKKIEEQAKLAKEFGFDYVYVKMSLKDAETVVHAFKLLGVSDITEVKITHQ